MNATWPARCSAQWAERRASSRARTEGHNVEGAGAGEQRLGAEDGREGDDRHDARVLRQRPVELHEQRVLQRRDRVVDHVGRQRPVRQCTFRLMGPCTTAKC